MGVVCGGGRRSGYDRNLLVWVLTQDLDKDPSQPPAASGAGAGAVGRLGTVGREEAEWRLVTCFGGHARGVSGCSISPDGCGAAACLGRRQRGGALWGLLSYPRTHVL